MTVKELIDLFKSFVDCTEYTAANGKHCFHAYGSEEYYHLLCKRCGIQSRWTGDFLHEANGDGYELDYCERDIILALNK